MKYFPEEAKVTYRSKYSKEEKEFSFDYNQRINILNEVKDDQLNEDGLFKRYAKNEVDRTLPGTKNGVYTCAGDEHDEVGEIIEDPKIRIEMVNRRAAKSKLIDSFRMHF